MAWFHGDMAFVHGHGRDATWVMSHLRAPNRAGEGQLELLDAEPDGEPPSIPAPREPVEEPVSPARRSSP